MLTHFPRGEATARQSLSDLFAAADAANISLDQGTYAIEREPEQNIARYVMSLPAVGRFEDIQRFVVAALKAHPTLALQSLRFERGDLADSQVEARLVFAFHYRPAS